MVSSSNWIGRNPAKVEMWVRIPLRLLIEKSSEIGIGPAWKRLEDSNYSGITNRTPGL